MSLPCTVHVLCSTWYREVNLIKSFVTYVHKINRQKEYYLSLAWIRTSRYQSIVDGRMKIKQHIRCGKYFGRIHRWIITLSCNEGSMRLRPECPWRARRWRIVPEISVQYWYLLFTPPPAAKHNFQRSSDQYCTCGSWFRRQFLILQNWTAPSFSRCTVWECRRRLIDYFLRNLVRRDREESPGSMSIHFLSLIGMMLGKSTSSLLCRFAFAFDLAAKTFTIYRDVCSSGRSAGTSVLLWFESITNSFDPWEILTQDWELPSLRDQILTSIPCLPYR